MAERIDVEQLLDLVADGAVLVDVLPDTVYRQEHLPGALNVPLATFRGEQLDGFDRDGPMIVYCFDQH